MRLNKNFLISKNYPLKSPTTTCIHRNILFIRECFGINASWSFIYVKLKWNSKGLLLI